MSGIFSKSSPDRPSRRKRTDSPSSPQQEAPLRENSRTQSSASAKAGTPQELSPDGKSRGRRTSRRETADTPALGLLKRISSGNTSVNEAKTVQSKALPPVNAQLDTPDDRQAESRRERRSAQPRSRVARHSAASEADSTPARSEAIRQKRGQGAQQVGNVLKPGLTSMARPMDRRHKARSNATISAAAARSSSGQPPVLVRRGTAGSSSGENTAGVFTGRQFTGQSPRRRFDIALSIPGAEVRLPAVPEVRFGWRLASAMLVIMMLGMLYMMFGTPTFQVESVQVNGLQRLTAMDVNLMLGLAGESIFSVDPQVVYDRLKAAFPELAAVELSIGLPHEVILDVVERTPVITWVQDGEERWIDADGVSFEPRGELGELVLLRVEAKGVPPDAEYVGVRQDEVNLSPELVTTMLSIQTFLPEAATVVYSPERGFGWHDDRGWDVYFGQYMHQMDQKLATYQTLVEALDDQGISPELISLEYLHAPYYRMER